jgi:hypothetical protein
MYVSESSFKGLRQPVVGTWSLDHRPVSESAQPRVTFISLQGEFPHKRVEPRVLARQAGFFPILWLDVNGPRGIRELRVTLE